MDDINRARLVAINNQQATKQLHLSIRRTIRLKRQYQTQGLVGIIHRSPENPLIVVIQKSKLTFREVDDHIKRMMNQAIFSKLRLLVLIKKKPQHRGANDFLVHQMRKSLHISSSTENIISCNDEELPIKLLNQETDRWYTILEDDFQRIK